METVTAHARTWTPERASAEKRDVWTALKRGFVGHIVVPAALWIETNYAPAVWLQLTVYLSFTLLASLALLQPVKGAVVGFQWALHMHGFDDNAPDEISPG